MKLISMNEQSESLLLTNKHIVNVLMDSPFYFTLPVCERKEIIERVFFILKKGVETIHI